MHVWRQNRILKKENMFQFFMKISLLIFSLVLYATPAQAALIGYESEKEVVMDTLSLLEQMEACDENNKLQCVGVPAKCGQYKAKWMATDVRIQRQAIDAYQQLDGFCEAIFRAVKDHASSSGRKENASSRQSGSSSQTSTQSQTQRQESFLTPSSGRTESSSSETSRPSSQGTSLPSSYTNDIGMEFVLLPAGSFMMGCNKNFGDCYSQDKLPEHRVTISQSFYMGKYEVTQAQWYAVMGKNPSKFQGWDKPVEAVSWNDAQAFIKKLNEKERTNKYRLPTEAEWEYAARAGSVTAYYFGNYDNLLSDYAWYGKNSDNETHAVGEKLPNNWGLYDMHGNVREWVQDWYADWYYGASPPVDPRGPETGENRVLRDCDWAHSDEKHCRVVNRGYWPGLKFESGANINLRSDKVGFRLAFTPEQ